MISTAPIPCRQFCTFPQGASNLDLLNKSLPLEASTLINNDHNPNLLPHTDSIENQRSTIDTPAPSDQHRKKAFVEPTVSVPVDVLETTAFFQGGTPIGDPGENTE